MSRNQKYPFFVLAIDIGGTKLGGAVLRYEDAKTQPEIIFQDKIPAQAKEGVEVLGSNIIKLAQSLKSKANEIDSSVPVVTIGMGCAGRINKQSGNVMTATDNFPGFVGFKLCSKVSEAISIPAYALNDVQSHTMGEARWGAGRNCDNFVLLAIGTGIGGAVVADGKLLMGSHGYAGELGHVQACLATDIPCTCGKSGHLEAIASGTGIEQRYTKFTGKTLSGPEISDLANKGDKDAVATIELAGRSLGQIIAMYQSIFDPEKIVLCGSVSKSGKLWKDAVMDGFSEEVIGEISKNLNLCDAELGDDAALIGAAEYALDRLDEDE